MKKNKKENVKEKEKNTNKETEEKIEASTKKAKEKTEKKTKEESNKLKERIVELEQKNEELNDRLIRRLAEFDNYKKRTEIEKEELFKYAAEPFILKILAVYEDLQRSLAHIDDENKDGLKEGLKMVADKFTQILTEQGVKKIDALGKEFDFEFHEALLQQESEDVPPNTIINEVESGYMYKDKVLKHAKVVVSKEAEESKEAQDEKEKEE
jgi:molecular chaperone GrpE